jgi:hypothetical protein
MSINLMHFFYQIVLALNYMTYYNKYLVKSIYLYIHDKISDNRINGKLDCEYLFIIIWQLIILKMK